jgi:hydrogenase maturation factor
VSPMIPGMGPGAGGPAPMLGAGGPPAAGGGAMAVGLEDQGGPVQMEEMPSFQPGDVAMAMQQAIEEGQMMLAAQQQEEARAFLEQQIMEADATVQQLLAMVSPEGQSMDGPAGVPPPDSGAAPVDDAPEAGVSAGLGASLADIPPEELAALMGA